MDEYGEGRPLTRIERAFDEVHSLVTQAHLETADLEQVHHAVATRGVMLRTIEMDTDDDVAQALCAEVRHLDVVLEAAVPADALRTDVIAQRHTEVGYEGRDGHDRRRRSGLGRRNERHRRTSVCRAD